MSKTGGNGRTNVRRSYYHPGCKPSSICCTPLRRSHRMREFKITLPATSANLGPAFDAAALALDLSISVTAAPARKYSIVATGLDSAICSRVEDHLILNTYREILEAEHKRITPLALTVANEFPIGRGLGSSAAAPLPRGCLAGPFWGPPWDRGEVIG